jgi:hypothetical protein
MQIDPRVVGAAYRELSTDGLVELKSRSGVYVAATARPNESAAASSGGWIADVLAGGVARGLRLTDIADWLRQATETLRLKAFVIAPTDDQVEGLRREVLTYYGIEARGETLEDLDRRPEIPLDLRRADLVISTSACCEESGQLSSALGLPCICVSGRVDLIGPPGQSLMQSPGYVVVADERFEAVFKSFIASQIDAGNVTVLVVNRDDLAVIPADAVVYVTQSARVKLGDTKLNGRILPSARVLSRESSHELTTFIVSENLAAVRSRRAAGT